MRSRLRLGRTARAVVAVALGALTSAGCDRFSTAPAATGPDISGEWQSGGSVYRVTADGAKITVTFETVSSDGQALGFKKGDLSLAGTRNGQFILGEQVIRYPANVPCHRETGRRVPFMAMIADDGKRIVLDWYNVSLDVKNCRDVGRTLGTTLLERRSG